MNSEHKCNKPNKDRDCNMVIDSQTPHVVDFDAWMEQELEVLEKKFSDFATKKSTRTYFSR